MHFEINIAVKFLTDFLRPKNGVGRLKQEQVDEFQRLLQLTIREKLTGHWHPDYPLRGSAYRCIMNQSIQGRMDPLLLWVGRNAGIPEFLLRRYLPVEMALWVDPSDVCYRIGEQGSICSLMGPEKENEISTLSTVSQAGGKSSRTNSLCSTSPSAGSPEKSMLQQQQQQQQQQQKKQLMRLSPDSLRTDSSSTTCSSTPQAEQPNDSGIELSPSTSPRPSANTISNSSSPSSSPLASPIREQPPNGMTCKEQYAMVSGMTSLREISSSSSSSSPSKSVAGVGGLHASPLTSFVR